MRFQSHNKFKGRPIDGALTILFALLAFVVVEACFSRHVIGQFQDDAFYLATAQSLAETLEARVPILATNPPASKYPPLYPALLSLPASFGLEYAIAFHALLVACAIASADRLSVRCQAPAAVRWLIAAALILHPSIVQCHAAFLSEALCLALYCTLVRAVLNQQSRKTQTTMSQHFVLIALSAALVLTRSAAFFLVLGLALNKTHKPSWKTIRPLILGLFVAFLAHKLWTLIFVPPALNSSKAFSYYLDYSFHTQYYTQRPLLSSLPQVLTVAKANTQFALRSLGRLLNPGPIIPLPLAKILPSLLAAAVLAVSFWPTNKTQNTDPQKHLDHPKLNPLSLIPYLAILCCWTWTFSLRFWLPILPVLILLVFQNLKDQKQQTCLALIALAGLMTWTPQLPLNQFQAQLDFSKPPPPKHKVSRYFYQLQQFRQQFQQQRRKTVLISDFHCFFLARECQCQGLWLTALLDNQRFLDRQLGFNLENLKNSDIAKLGRRLQQLQQQHKELNFLVHVDLQCQPWFIKCCQDLASQGFLQQKLQQNGVSHSLIKTPKTGQ